MVAPTAHRRPTTPSWARAGRRPPQQQRRERSGSQHGHRPRAAFVFRRRCVRVNPCQRPAARRPVDRRRGDRPQDPDHQRRRRGVRAGARPACRHLAGAGAAGPGPARRGGQPPRRSSGRTTSGRRRRRAAAGPHPRRRASRCARWQGSNGLQELVVPPATTLHDAAANLGRVVGKARRRLRPPAARPQRGSCPRCGRCWRSPMRSCRPRWPAARASASSALWSSFCLHLVTLARSSWIDR